MGQGEGEKSNHNMEVLWEIMQNVFVFFSVMV